MNKNQNLYIILTGNCFEKYTEWYKSKGMEDFSIYGFSLDVLAPMFFACMQVFFESIDIEINYKKGINIKTDEHDGWDWSVNDYEGFSEEKIDAIISCVQKANEIHNSKC